MSQPIIFEDWGLTSYQEAWDHQEQLFKAKTDLKFQNRIQNDSSNIVLPKQHLIFCEHPHVYTLGKSGKRENLLISEEELVNLGASFYPINRGGDITYHGPGQIVGYPIFDLEQIYTDIHRYLRELEESIILTLKDYGVQAGRYEGYTGVWLDPEDDNKARKICAMGVRCSRWVTMHGFAFNVNTDLSMFEHIVPCGIEDKQVTSLEKELGRKLDIEEVKQTLLKHLLQIFNLVY